MKTWQVGLITFFIVSGIFTPIGILCIIYLWNKKKSRERPNVEKLRKEYKMLWDDMR